MRTNPIDSAVNNAVEVITTSLAILRLALIALLGGIFMVIGIVVNIIKDMIATRDAIRRNGFTPNNDDNLSILSLIVVAGLACYLIYRVMKAVMKRIATVKKVEASRGNILKAAQKEMKRTLARIAFPVVNPKFGQLAA